MTAPLPPGSTGLPLIGETLALLRNSYQFVQERVARHGPIFRTSVLGKGAVFVSGPVGTQLFNDDAVMQRAGGMPGHIEQFFGGKSLPLLDGSDHRTRKQQVLAAFGREALESYLPAMQATVERFFAEKASAGEWRASDDLKVLALEVISRNMLSLEPGPELDSVIEAFAVFTRGLNALPLPLPGTRFSRTLKARDRILEVIRAAVKRHRERDHGDGLSRLLGARSAEGQAISDESAVLELHHFNIAGYVIYTLFCALVAELHRHPAVRERLQAEIAAQAATGPLGLGQLEAMPVLGTVVKEAKRFTPFVPVFFGKARRDFDLNGYRVPAGWRVVWSQHATNFAADSFDRPESFDPDRFAEPRAEHRRHPCAFAPQGAGDLATSHRCAGYDYSTMFLQVFLVVLLRGYTWELPPQNLAYDYERVPADHTDGLRVILRPRA